MRDGVAVGIGGLLGAAMAAYLTANENMPGYHLPWEKPRQQYPHNLAPAREIIRLASDGATEYQNPVGEPVIIGCSRAVEMVMPSGVISDGRKVPPHRLAWFKPIMASGGIGTIQRAHIHKKKIRRGRVVGMIGGEARDVGFAGGSGASMASGESQRRRGRGRPASRHIPSAWRRY